MKVKTKSLGEIEIDSRQQISFSVGLLGFENLRNYVLLDSEQPPFYWLQSLDVSEIAFVLIKPAIFRPDYETGLNKEDLKLIGIEEDEEPLVFAIVTVPEDSSQMTANLQGPVLINKKTHQAKQYIVSDPRWTVRHNILEELSSMRNDVC